jgi:hypothetical protein
VHLNALARKRPELAVRGMTLVVVSELAKKYGFRKDIKSGEDGSLVLRLKEFGKIVFIHDKRAIVMTGWRTMDKDGSLTNTLFVRLKRHISNLSYYFTSERNYEDSGNNIDR